MLYHYLTQYESKIEFDLFPMNKKVPNLERDRLLPEFKKTANAWLSRGYDFKKFKRFIGKDKVDSSKYKTVMRLIVRNSFR